MLNLISNLYRIVETKDGKVENVPRTLPLHVSLTTGRDLFRWNLAKNDWFTFRLCTGLWLGKEPSQFKATLEIKSTTENSDFSFRTTTRRYTS
jgi:hypothetical protein